MNAKLGRWMLSAALVSAVAALAAAQNSALQSLEQWAGDKTPATSVRGVPIPIPIPVPVPRPSPEPESGFDEAYRACDRASWPMDRRRCYDTIRRAWYFQRQPAWVCGGLSSRGIADCIEAIADKWYDRWEVDRCSAQSRDWWVVDCFRRSGRYRRG